MNARSEDVSRGAVPETIYWTAAEFGVLVGLSAKSIFRLVRDDPSFPAVKILGSVRIPKERALKWLRDREQGGGRVVTMRRTA